MRAAATEVLTRQNSPFEHGGADEGHAAAGDGSGRPRFGARPHTVPTTGNRPSPAGTGRSHRLRAPKRETASDGKLRTLPSERRNAAAISTDSRSTWRWRSLALRRCTYIVDRASDGTRRRRVVRGRPRRLRRRLPKNGARSRFASDGLRGARVRAGAARVARFGKRAAVRSHRTHAGVRALHRPESVRRQPGRPAREPSSASNSPSRPMPASGSAGTGVTAVPTDSSDQLLPLAGP